MKHPIENITWVNVEDLSANDYNPNMVFDQELKLLKHSLLTSGWIQPVLCTQDYEVIDGYHRWWLTKNDEEMFEFTNGKVPCAVMELTKADRIMLTVRINRAKGSHMAIKMHELVQQLVTEHAVSIKDVCTGIGATKAEVELLLQEGVFKKLDIENHKYSKAWYPKPKSERKK